MIDMATSNPGHRSYREHLPELETAVTNPGRLGVELYSIGLIDREAKERASLVSASQLERSRELLGTLETKIELEKKNFDKFLSILHRDPTMQDIWERLTTTRGSWDNSNLADFLYKSECNFLIDKYKDTLQATSISNETCQSGEHLYNITQHFVCYCN